MLDAFNMTAADDSQNVVVAALIRVAPGMGAKFIETKQHQR